MSKLLSRSYTPSPDVGVRRRLLGACLLGAGLVALAGCDSQSQLTASRVSSVATAAATESIQVVGASTTISYQIAKASLPADIAGGANLAVVLGGRPVPVTQMGNLVVANLPPNTAPLVPDSSGNASVLVQSDAGSAVVTLHIGTLLTPIPSAQATVSVK